MQLWDAKKQQNLRTMTGHNARVGSLTWNKHILASGSSSGQIHIHDVRVQDHLLNNISAAHGQEVCGLSWSLDGTTLAR